MITIGEAIEKEKRAILGVNYFGCTSKWKIKFDAHRELFHEMILKDHGVTMDQIQRIPQHTTLGPHAHMAYVAFCVFLVQNHAVNKGSLGL